MSADITVIVATRNRGDAPVQVVRDVLAQSIDAEVVVVDQSDPEARVASAAAFAALEAPGLRYVSSGTVGLPAARNEALAHASAPVVLFLDDDVRLLAGCLEAHLAAYADPWVGGVTGRIVERVVRPNAATTTNRLSLGGRVRTRLDGPTATELATTKGANMSFRRVALDSAGPADAGFAGTAFLEDADWSTRVRRLGWTLRYEPAAAVIHLSLPAGGCRADDDAKREWWRFRNTAFFVRRHRPWTAPVVLGTFGLVAARRAVEWRSPLAPARLVGALVAGWRAGIADPDPG